MSVNELSSLGGINPLKLILRLGTLHPLFISYRTVIIYSMIRWI